MGCEDLFLFFSCLQRDRIKKSTQKRLVPTELIYAVYRCSASPRLALHRGIYLLPFLVSVVLVLG